MGENMESQNTALLAEILGVLKRIDGHLESQDGRINDLDAKVKTLMSGPIQSANSSHETNPSNPDKGDSAILEDEQYDKNSTRQNSIAPSQSPQLSAISGEDSPHLQDHTANEFANSRLDDEVNRHQTPAKTAKDLVAESHVNLDSSRLDEVLAYSRFPPPKPWVATFTRREMKSVKYDSVEYESLWSSHVGALWTIPPDGRIEMSFQRHILDKMDISMVVPYLKMLETVWNRLVYLHPDDKSSRRSFAVTDFGFNPNVKPSRIGYYTEFSMSNYKSYTAKVVPSMCHMKVKDTEQRTGFWKRIM